MQRDSNLAIFGLLHDFLEQGATHKLLYCRSLTDFSRRRKLGFGEVSAFILSLPKLSLSVELGLFFGRDNACSKSAFCQQRMKIKPCFFEDLNRYFVELYEAFYGNYLHRWKGFRLLAIDGSTEYLLNKPAVEDFFGTQVNQSMSIPMARILNCFDVMNKISIRSELAPITQSEQSIAHRWVEDLPEDALGLYDRGFAGFALFYLHLKGYEKQKNFVIRCKTGFNNDVKKFVSLGRNSEIVDLKATKNAIDSLLKMGYKINLKTTVRVRFVRVKLPNGEVEVLITSLLDQDQYPNQIFKSLYFKRWAVETEFGAWKNTYQLEQFSGHSVTAIYQEFYATVLMANIHLLLINHANKKITKQQRPRKTKYSYKVNRNVTFEPLKRVIACIFTHQNQIQIVKTLICLFCKYKEPIRHKRKEPRHRKLNRTKGKYQTVTNYKRAV